MFRKRETHLNLASYCGHSRLDFMICSTVERLLIIKRKVWCQLPELFCTDELMSRSSVKFALPATLCCISCIVTYRQTTVLSYTVYRKWCITSSINSLSLRVVSNRNVFWYILPWSGSNKDLLLLASLFWMIQIRFSAVCIRSPPLLFYFSESQEAGWCIQGPSLAPDEKWFSIMSLSMQK